MDKLGHKDFLRFNMFCSTQWGPGALDLQSLNFALQPKIFPTGDLLSGDQSAVED